MAYYFEYGTTTAYGTQTSPAGAGSGSTPVGVHQAIFGLSPNTTYHYRLVAHSSAGTTNGADQTFTTTTTNPSKTVVLGHEGFVSPGWIVGAEVGCFHGTSTCNGHLTMSHDGTTIARRDYSIAPDSGGFQNMEQLDRSAGPRVQRRVPPPPGDGDGRAVGRPDVIMGDPPRAVGVALIPLS